MGLVGSYTLNLQEFDFRNWTCDLIVIWYDNTKTIPPGLQQQQPSLNPLSGVGYMDQITPYCSIIIPPRLSVIIVMRILKTKFISHQFILFELYNYSKVHLKNCWWYIIFTLFKSCCAIAYSTPQIYHLLTVFNCMNTMQDNYCWCLRWLWNHQHKWRCGIYVEIVYRIQAWYSAPFSGYVAMSLYALVTLHWPLMQKH